MFEKYKSKKWTQRIIKKNLQCNAPVEFSKYAHETDKKALETLKKIPFFDILCGKFIEFFNEPIIKISNMSNCVRISKEQLPKIYQMVESICKKLGINVPELYLSLNREPNAGTTGCKNYAIIINSGLLECLEDDEIYAVLAHECGHIACDHVLYHTMGKLILTGGEIGISFLDGGLIGKIISMPLKLAFFNWMRCSEFSADRAAMVCCENSKPVVETMMRLAGGTTNIGTQIDTEQFIAQTQEYKQLMNTSKLNKTLEFLMTYDYTHPLLSVRASEALTWEKTQQFKNIIT